MANKNVTCKIKLYKPRVKKLTGAMIPALEKTAELLHTEIAQDCVIPRMDGALQGEKFFIDNSNADAGHVSLVHEGPYARRLYYHPEYNFHREPWEDENGRRHDGNPNAKGHWFEDWEEGGKHADFAQNTFEKLYKQETEI